jgi:hypothetical protein
MEGMQQEQFLHLDEILESLKGELQQIRSESQIRLCFCQWKQS